jgi:hypothetical protein
LEIERGDGGEVLLNQGCGAEGVDSGVLLVDELDIGVAVLCDGDELDVVVLVRAEVDAACWEGWLM